MKTLLCLLTMVLYSSSSVGEENAIKVVANVQDSSIQLSRQQVRNLFMGGKLPYDLTAISLPPNSHTRVLFNTKVVGLTESRIQSYWAQMRFTGRKKPPTELSSELLVLEYLQTHPGTVAYLPADVQVPAGLTILFQIH